MELRKPLLLDLDNHIDLEESLLKFNDLADDLIETFRNIKHKSTLPKQ